MPNQEQIKRMNDINDLIKLIASIDHRTFYRKSKDRIAYFRFKKNCSSLMITRVMTFIRMKWDTGVQTAFRMEATCGNWSTVLESSS